MKEISATSKKAFISWFIRQFDLRKKECHWILNFFCENETRMNHLHFVSDYTKYKNGIMMATNCSNEIFHFQFLYNNDSDELIKTPYTDVAYQYIRENQGLDFYLDIRFKERENYSQFLNIIEGEKPEVKLPKEYSDTAQSLIDNILFESKIKQLKAEIDDSLFEMNKNKFNSLTNSYIELLNNQPLKLYELIKKKKV